MLRLCNVFNAYTALHVYRDSRNYKNGRQKLVDMVTAKYGYDSWAEYDLCLEKFDVVNKNIARIHSRLKEDCDEEKKVFLNTLLVGYEMQKDICIEKINQYVL